MTLRYTFIDPNAIEDYERIGWERAGLILGSSIGMVWAGDSDQPVIPIQHGSTVRKPDWRRRRMYAIRKSEREGNK